MESYGNVLCAILTSFELADKPADVLLQPGYLLWSHLRNHANVSSIQWKPASILSSVNFDITLIRNGGLIDRSGRVERKIICLSPILPLLGLVSLFADNLSHQPRAHSPAPHWKPPKSLAEVLHSSLDLRTNKLPSPSKNHPTERCQRPRSKTELKANSSSRPVSKSNTTSETYQRLKSETKPQTKPQTTVTTRICCRGSSTTTWTFNHSYTQAHCFFHGWRAGMPSRSIYATEHTSR